MRNFIKKIWNFIKEMWKKYEEVINYLIFGFLAFVLSIVIFYIFANMVGLNEQIANIISWIICVIFCYFTNRIFVFKSKTKEAAGMIKEFVDFVLARLATLIIENAILFVMIELLSINNMISKLVGQVVVIVTNYILSKLWIFKKKPERDGEE